MSEVKRRAIIDWEWGNKVASVVESTSSPWTFWLVALNPDWSAIWPFLKIDQTTPQTVSNGSPIFSNGIEFWTDYTPTWNEPTGTMYWSEEDEMFVWIGNNWFKYNFWDELTTLCQNDTGVIILNGTPVMYAGSVWNSWNIRIVPAIADGSIPADYMVWIATQDIIDWDRWKVTRWWKVRDISTDIIPSWETWANWDLIYVSATTAWWLTKVMPEAPNYWIFVGAVVAINANFVTIDVWVNIPSKITDLSDVNGTPLTTNGQIMYWDQTRWVFDFSTRIILNDTLWTWYIPSLVSWNINWEESILATFFWPDNSIVWRNSNWSYVNNNYTAPDTTLTASTHTMTLGNMTHYDRYRTIWWLTPWKWYKLTAYVKLWTASNFALVVNNAAAWNTIGWKVYTSYDWLNTTDWTLIEFKWTQPSGRTLINLHIWANQELLLASTPQTAWTVFLWNIKIEEYISSPILVFQSWFGDVAIWKQTATEKLDVNGNIKTNAWIILDQATSQLVIWASTFPTASTVSKLWIYAPNPTSPYVGSQFLSWNATSFTGIGIWRTTPDLILWACWANSHYLVWSVQWDSALIHTGKLHFGSTVNWSSQVVFDNSWNIGIWTTSPTSKLHIVWISDIVQWKFQSYSAQTSDVAQFWDISAWNYTAIEDDGTIKFHWDATVFDDLNGSALQLKVLGIWLSINSSENTLNFTTASNLKDYWYDNYQMKHTWKIGTVIYPHIHWVQKENNTPNFLIQYRWQVNWWATTTAWTNYPMTTNAYTYTSWSLNQITHNSGITPPVWAWLSDIIQFRIIRDNDNDSWEFAWTDAYTQTVNIMFVDIHIEQDTFGSREEYSK